VISTKGKLIAASAAILLSSMANAYTFTTGSKTGTYFKVGNNFTRLVEGGTVIHSKGSIENLNRISSGEADIGITQMDAFMYWRDKNPDKSENLEVLGKLYKECVYVAVNTEGKIKSEDDLENSGVTIAVGKQGSGSAVTWDYMRKLEEGYKKPAVSFKGGVRALGQLASEPDGSINAVLWVTKPNLSGKLLKTVLNNPNLMFIDMDDYDINDEYNGSPVYSFETIEIEKGVFNDTEITTPCVSAIVVANSNADEDFLDKSADIVLNYRSSLLVE
jgi:TRAP-type uncharacterized transport system substrate-binding protein